MAHQGAAAHTACPRVTDAREAREAFQTRRVRSVRPRFSVVILATVSNQRHDPARNKRYLMRLPSVARQIDRDGNERRFGGNCGFYSVAGLIGNVALLLAEDDGVPHAARSSLIVVGRRLIPTVMLNEQ